MSTCRTCENRTKDNTCIPLANGRAQRLPFDRESGHTIVINGTCVAYIPGRMIEGVIPLTEAYKPIRPIPRK